MLQTVEMEILSIEDEITLSETQLFFEYLVLFSAHSFSFRRSLLFNAW